MIDNAPERPLPSSSWVPEYFNSSVFTWLYISLKGSQRMGTVCFVPLAVFITRYSSLAPGESRVSCGAKIG